MAGNVEAAAKLVYYGLFVDKAQSRQRRVVSYAGMGVLYRVVNGFVVRYGQRQQQYQQSQQ